MRRSAAVSLLVVLLTMLQKYTISGLDADSAAGKDSPDDGFFTKEESDMELHPTLLSENFLPITVEQKLDLQRQQQQQTFPLQEDKKLDEESPAGAMEEVEDDRTYLDIFGETAKEFLTQRLIPTSDPECRWSWRHGRCEPVCLCHFQPKLGDLHLGRACRRWAYDVDEPCPSVDDDISLLRFIPTPVIDGMIQRIKQRSKSIQKQLSTNLVKAYGAIQVQVCEDLNRECLVDDSRWTSDRIFAWQERLFCREIIDDCTGDNKASALER
jgi:hypothetical protein